MNTCDPKPPEQCSCPCGGIILADTEEWKIPLCDSCYVDAGEPAKDPYRALEAARREGVAEGIELAAKEAESWWTLFNFESFDPSDVRRAANPNQIATRIRHLAAEVKR